MCTVIIAIAKFEQDYIEEWVIYHLALGFDKIYLYDNEDEAIYYKILTKYGGRIVHTHIKGNEYEIGVQYRALHHFHSTYISSEIKYAMHIDIDEFVCLKKHKNIKEFINEYFKPGIAAISLCWRFFGSSGQVKKMNEPVVSRFRRCASQGDILMKTLYDVTKITAHTDCHSVKPIEGHVVIATNGVVTTCSENPDNDISVACVNHYYCKTIPEFFYSKTRGRADIPGGLKGHPFYGDPTSTALDMDLIKCYTKRNLNDVEDLTAYNFYNAIKYLILVP